MRADTLEFVKRTAIAVAIVLLPLLAWYLRNFLLVFVGALLVAMLLQLISEPLVRWCRIPEALALALAGLFVLFAIGGSGYLFGTDMGSELHDVLNRANAATQTILDGLHHSQLGQMALSHLGDSNFPLPASLGVSSRSAPACSRRQS